MSFFNALKKAQGGIFFDSAHSSLSANPTKWSNTLKQFVGCC